MQNRDINETSFETSNFDRLYELISNANVSLPESFINDKNPTTFQEALDLVISARDLIARVESTSGGMVAYAKGKVEDYKLEYDLNYNAILSQYSETTLKSAKAKNMCSDIVKNIKIWTMRLNTARQLQKVCITISDRLHSLSTDVRLQWKIYESQYATPSSSRTKKVKFKSFDEEISIPTESEDILDKLLNGESE